MRRAALRAALPQCHGESLPGSGIASTGSHEKDRLENRLHTMVCSGQITLRHAQQAIADDWVKAFKVYVLPI